MRVALNREVPDDVLLGIRIVTFAKHNYIQCRAVSQSKSINYVMCNFQRNWNPLYQYVSSLGLH